MKTNIPDLESKNKNYQDFKSKLDFFNTVFSQKDFDAIKGPLQEDAATNGNTSRSIQKILINSQEVFFSTYFSLSKDPQRGTFTDTNDFKYIEPFYSSLTKLGLSGLIFHDNLSEEFIQQHSTDKIKFVKCTLGPYSLNDERYFLYYMYLLTYGKQIKKVFMIDVSDVYITKSPFDLIAENKQLLFLGRSNIEKIKHSYPNYLRIGRFEKDMKMQMPSSYYDMKIFNAGTIGGSTPVVLYLLHQMLTAFSQAKSNRNHNMTIMNYCVHKFWLEAQHTKNVKFLSLRKSYLKLASFIQSKLNINLLPKSHFCQNENYTSKTIYSGFPFNSVFKKFEYDSEAYLIHK